jgi:peptide/nickel transport system permease protein
MAHHILRRVLLSLFALFGVVLLVFLLTHIVPGDPARLAAGPQARAEQVENVRKAYGLDKPLPMQLVIYLGDLLHGDLGDSLLSRRAVSADLIDYFPATLELTLVSILIAIVGGVGLGILSAIHKNELADNVARIISLSGVSMPVFWLGIILILLFYRQLGWLPFGGRIDPNIDPPMHITGLYVLDSILTGNLPALGSSLLYLILPSITLGFGSLGVVSRMTRASLLEVLQEDYIRTARAKGLVEKYVLLRHAMKNALIPIITIVGLQFGGLLGGAFLVEVIFSWPGIGTYAMKAITFLDYNAIIGATLLTAIVFMLTNLVVDLLYIVIDPRLRKS